MIVCREKDSIYFAYSLSTYTRIIGSNLTFKTMLEKDNLFFWKVINQENTIMSGSREMNFNDLIRYDKNVVDCKEINMDNILKIIRPNMIDRLGQFGIHDKNMFNNSYFIANKNKAFHIFNCDVEELEEFACEYNVPFVTAMFAKYENLDFLDKLYHGICDMEAITKERFFPIVITDTKTMKVNVLHDDGKVEYLYDL